MGQFARRAAFTPCTATAQDVISHPRPSRARPEDDHPQAPLQGVLHAWRRTLANFVNMISDPLIDIILCDDVGNTGIHAGVG